MNPCTLDLETGSQPYFHDCLWFGGRVFISRSEIFLLAHESATDTYILKAQVFIVNCLSTRHFFYAFYAAKKCFNKILVFLEKIDKENFHQCFILSNLLTDEAFVYKFVSFFLILFEIHYHSPNQADKAFHLPVS